MNLAKQSREEKKAENSNELLHDTCNLCVANVEMIDDENEKGKNMKRSDFLIAQKIGSNLIELWGSLILFVCALA